MVGYYPVVPFKLWVKKMFKISSLKTKINSVGSKSTTCIFLGSIFSTSSCFVLSCLFRRMTCFWVLWPCNPDGCIHINKRISETLMSLKMENQWLAHAEWEIFSLIWGQLISIFNNQTNYCKGKLLSLTLLHLLSGVLSWKAKSSGAFETLETPQAWSWMLEQSFKKIPINFTIDLKSDLFWKWLFDLLFNFMCHLFVICGSALAKNYIKISFPNLMLSNSLGWGGPMLVACQFYLSAKSSLAKCLLFFPDFFGS